mmetsp:Transcript_1335/g.2918  ORF Transcript_1335/g.2918 Transcript_1335/m.2918 type:complete len:469 (-) Transcript_1335:365-1771(-)
MQPDLDRRREHDHEGEEGEVGAKEHEVPDLHHLFGVHAVKPVVLLEGHLLLVLLHRVLVRVRLGQPLLVGLLLLVVGQDRVLDESLRDLDREDDGYHHLDVVHALLVGARDVDAEDLDVVDHEGDEDEREVRVDKREAHALRHQRRVVLALRLPVLEVRQRLEQKARQVPKQNNHGGLQRRPEDLNEHPPPVAAKRLMHHALEHLGAHGRQYVEAAEHCHGHKRRHDRGGAPEGVGEVLLLVRDLVELLVRLGVLHKLDPVVLNNLDVLCAPLHLVRELYAPPPRHELGRPQGDVNRVQRDEGVVHRALLHLRYDLHEEDKHPNGGWDPQHRQQIPVEDEEERDLLTKVLANVLDGLLPRGVRDPVLVQPLDLLLMVQAEVPLDPQVRYKLHQRGIPRLASLLLDELRAHCTLVDVVEHEFHDLTLLRRAEERPLGALLVQVCELLLEARPSARVLDSTTEIILLLES